MWGSVVVGGVWSSVVIGGWIEEKDGGCLL